MSSCELTICTSLTLSESFPCSSSRYRFVIKLVCVSINSRYSCFASSCGLFSAVFARKLKLSSFHSGFWLSGASVPPGSASKYLCTFSRHQILQIQELRLKKVESQQSVSFCFSSYILVPVCYQLTCSLSNIIMFFISCIAFIEIFTFGRLPQWLTKY